MSLFHSSVSAYASLHFCGMSSSRSTSEAHSEAGRSARAEFNSSSVTSEPPRDKDSALGFSWKKEIRKVRSTELFTRKLRFRTEGSGVEFRRLRFSVFTDFNASGAEDVMKLFFSVFTLNAFGGGWNRSWMQVRSIELTTELSNDVGAEKILNWTGWMSIESSRSTIFGTSTSFGSWISGSCS